MRKRTLRFRKVDKNNFEDVRLGKKSIETRAATMKYRSIAEGDTLIFVCGTDRIEKRVAAVHHFSSIDAMLRKLPREAIMPDLDSVADIKRRYASYPGYEEKIREHGILAFELA
ncbi:MAG: hypothetical protein ACM3TU_01485 [Bacillota bacterium]